MLKFYKTENNAIVEIPEVATGCWISLIAPTEEEINSLQNSLDLDKGFLQSALDEEESSRVEVGDDQTLIVLDYPVAEKSDDKDGIVSYYTMPMGIILTNSNVITISLKQNVIIDDIARNAVKGIQTQFKTRFIFTLLLKISAKYLLYLKQIDKLSNSVERKLHKSMKNKELIQLLGLGKSLVYFSTSLKTTETVLEKILRGRIIKLYDDDQDLLEDVIIEIKQAIEMSNIYSNILSGTMDAFASVISNNLNIVMKILTVITIVMAVPNMVFSFYGMNVVDLPLPYTVVPVAISLVLAVVLAIVLTKSRFYK